MQKTLTTKLVATTIALVLIVALILCIAPVQTAHAEEAVWEKIDYSKLLYEEYPEQTIYSYSKNSTQYILPYKYLYIFLNGAGGMGGASADNGYGYGGGSGGFFAVKVDIRAISDVIISLGKGGGKFEFDEGDEREYGEGFYSAVVALRGATQTKPFAIDAVGCHGGKYGNGVNPGQGGETLADTKNNFIQVIYSQNGVAGGQASHSFSVDLGFRTEHFIYRPAGATPSGKGGGASVYHRGGDGGVLYKNGSDGSMGAGGGGAGRGATQGGYGGDAYMEIYGSNM